MEHQVGIEVSLLLSSLCVLDATGKVVREARVISKPEALVAFLIDLRLPIARIGLEAGPLSQWIYDGLLAAGFNAVLLEMETRDIRRRSPQRRSRSMSRTRAVPRIPGNGVGGR